MYTQIWNFSEKSLIFFGKLSKISLNKPAWLQARELKVLQVKPS
jgi:hypothetical protein